MSAQWMTSQPFQTQVEMYYQPFQNWRLSWLELPMTGSGLPIQLLTRYGENIANSTEFTGRLYVNSSKCK